jgi:hypothetical protein
MAERSKKSQPGVDRRSRVEASWKGRTAEGSTETCTNHPLPGRKRTQAEAQDPQVTVETECMGILHHGDNIEKQ